MPESEIFIVRCGRPIWPSHAGLSENSPQMMPFQTILITYCGWDGKTGPAMSVYPLILSI